jgi:hypothetical protein
MTKLMITFFTGIFLFMLAPQQLKACDIEVEVLKGKKEVYQVGDTIIVKISVSLTHRSCPVAIKKTKFKLNGLKVIKATGWKQLSTMDYERKLKIVITAPGKVSLNVVRDCDKDGGFGSLKLKAEAKKS